MSSLLATAGAALLAVSVVAITWFVGSTWLAAQELLDKIEAPSGYEVIDQQTFWPTMLLLETGEADIGTLTLERTSAEDPKEMRGELEGWLVADHGFEPTTISIQGALQLERPRPDGLEADIAWVVVGEGLSSSSGALVNVTFADLDGLTVSRWSILVGLLGVLVCLAALLTSRVRALHDSPPPPMLSGSH